jgi:hypothetical protein
MAKGIKITAIVIIVLVLAGFLILTLTIDSIVKSKIEQIGSEMTGTMVTVDNVSMSPFSGEGTITGLRIANPDGYDSDHAIVIDDMFIKARVRTIFSDVVVIEEILVTRPAIYIEQKLPDNNLGIILNNINEAAERGTTSDANMVVHYFRFEDATVNVYTDVGGERSISFGLAEIELNDIGGEGESTAVEQVVKQISDRIIQNALQAAIREGTDQLREAIEDLFD